MPKNIVLLADGTGNSAASPFKTNVWRLYTALDLNDQKQIALFTDGVGTSGFRPFKYLGLALGLGVQPRVLQLYKFLCLTYQPGDRIFVFGFSRGAFIARLLVGLVCREGLVEFSSLEELDRNAVAAYRASRAQATDEDNAAFRLRTHVMRLVRGLRDRVIDVRNRASGYRSYSTVRPETGARSAPEIRIAFLGVWDTVAAYGLPIDELTQAYDRWIWPLTFERRGLLDCVERARQALSLDDARRTFFPIPWDPENAEGPIPRDRLLQVWFAGVHANVGGGYPDDRLAHLPLCWMIAEAADAGLQFNPQMVADYWDIASEYGRVYDSRANLGLFYRYDPRRVSALMHANDTPVVDWSVILRVASGPDGYAPLSLPVSFDVRMPDDRCIKVSDFRHTSSGPQRAPFIREKLPLPAHRPRDLAALDTQILDALKTLGARQGGATPDAGEQLTRTWDAVWWRRGFYYGTLGLVLLGLASPLMPDFPPAGGLALLDGLAQTLFRMVAGVLAPVTPEFLSPWVDAAHRNPLSALVWLAATAATVRASDVMGVRIGDRARRTWHGGLLRKAEPQAPASLRLARAIRTNRFILPVYHMMRRTILPLLALLVSGWLLLGVASKSVFEIAGSFGFVCPEPKPAGTERTLTGFDPKSLCWDSGIDMVQGKTYRITIAATARWLDLKVPSGVLGIEDPTLLQVVAIPFRRWWREPYFQPVARVGRYGADEQPLKPASPPRSGEDPSRISRADFLFTPGESGRLYLYLNDLVIPWFYANNQGSADITVVEDGAPAATAAGTQ